MIYIAILGKSLSYIASWLCVHCSTTAEYFQAKENRFPALSQSNSDIFKSRGVDFKILCTDGKCHRKLVFKTRQNRGFTPAQLNFIVAVTRRAELQNLLFRIGVEISKPIPENYFKIAYPY